jgi:hypothetical protein
MMVVPPDGTLGIPYLMSTGKWDTLSKHEFDLLTRISQVLGLDGTHILSCEEAMMAYGKVYDTLLGGKNGSLIKKEWHEAYLQRTQRMNQKLDEERERARM